MENDSFHEPAMLEEQANIVSLRSDAVRGLGWRILLAAETTPESIARIVDAWSVVASLGRDSDVHLGDWPSDNKISQMLPSWMSSERFDGIGFGFDTWCEDIEDRDWIWWSICRLQSGPVRIDLKAFSMPMSDWTIRAVIELAGATIIDRDLASVLTCE